MNNIVVLDLGDLGFIPSILTNSIGHPLEINRSKFLGFINKTSDCLSIIDSVECISSLLVISKNDYVNEPLLDSSWGYGARSYRDVSDSWISISILEGRIESITWITLVGDEWFINGCKHDPDINVSMVLESSCTSFLIVRESNPSQVRLRDATLPADCNPISLWHCSPVGDIEILKPANGRLWASFSKSFAACFGARPYSNHGWYQGVDLVSSGQPKIYIVCPSELSKHLSHKVTLYRFEAEMISLCQDGIKGYEFFSHQAFDVLDAYEFSSCYELLHSLSVEIIDVSTSPILDIDLANSCWNYRHAIEAFLSMPLDVAVRLPCKQWALRLWSVSRGLSPFTVYDLPFLETVIKRYWIPIIAAGSPLSEYGYHSLDHLITTSLVAAWIAVREDVNPILPVLIGLLHDCARTDDSDGNLHAIEGVRLAKALLGSDLKSLLTPREWSYLKRGIALHASEMSTNNPIIACAWDADRLRLAWEYGFNPSMFGTAQGRSLAAMHRAEAIEKIEADFISGLTSL